MGGSLASRSDGASAIVQALAGAALVTLIVAAASATLAEQGRMLDSYIELSELASLRALEKLSVKLAPGGVRVRNEGAVGVEVAYVLAKTGSGVVVSRVGVTLAPGEEAEVAVPDQAEGAIVVTARGNAFAAASAQEARTYGSSWVFGSVAGSAVRLFANPWNLTYIYVVEGEGTVVHVLNGTTLEVLDSFLPLPNFERKVKLSDGKVVCVGVERVVPSLDHRYVYLISTDGGVAVYDARLKDYVATWRSPNPLRSRWLHWNSGPHSYSRPFDSGTEVLYAATLGSKLILLVHVYDPYTRSGWPAYNHYYRVYSYEPNGARKMVLNGTSPFTSFSWVSGTEARIATSDRKFLVLTESEEEVRSYGVPMSGSFDFDVVDAHYRKWRVAWVKDGTAVCYEFRANYTNLPWWNFSANYSYRVFKRWIVVTSTYSTWEDTSKETVWGTYYTWLVQSFTVPSSLDGWNVSYVDACLDKFRNPTYGTLCIYTLRREYVKPGEYDYYLDAKLESSATYTQYQEFIPGVGTVTWTRFYFSNNTRLSRTSWDSYAIVWKPDGSYNPHLNYWRITQTGGEYTGGKAWEKIAGPGDDPYEGKLLAPDLGHYEDFWIKIHLVNELGETATLTVQVTPANSFGYAEVNATATASIASDELAERVSIELVFPSYLPLLSYSSSFSASGTVSESLVAVNSTHTKYVATWRGDAGFGTDISATVQETQGWPPVSKSYSPGRVLTAFTYGGRLAVITGDAVFIYDVAADALVASIPLSGSYPSVSQPTGYDFAYSSAGFYLCEQGYIELFDWGSKLLVVGAADYKLYREHVPAAAVSERAAVAYVLSYAGTGVRVQRAESSP